MLRKESRVTGRSCKVGRAGHQIDDAKGVRSGIWSPCVGIGPWPGCWPHAWEMLRLAIPDRAASSEQPRRAGQRVGAQRPRNGPNARTPSPSLLPSLTEFLGSKVSRQKHRTGWRLGTVLSSICLCRASREMRVSHRPVEKVEALFVCGHDD